jgi:hypothetical protein
MRTEKFRDAGKWTQRSWWHWLSDGWCGRVGCSRVLTKDVLDPPIEAIGARSVNAFMKATARRALAAAITAC